MPRGFVLSCESERREFGALPIRIGRNGLNDFPLPYQIVSAFHARIEDAGGVVGVVDLNSKNGSFVREPGGSLTRLPPGQHVDLGPYGNEFLLGPNVILRLEVVEGRMAARPFSGSVLGNPQMLGERSSQRPQTGARPPQPGGLPSLKPIQPLPSIDASRRAVARSAPPRAEPGWGRPPQQPAPSHAPPGISSGTDQFNVELPELALTGLRELAASLIPHQRVETTGDVARLVTRLHDAIEIFCRCFIPLREGHAQFVSSFDLQHEATQRGKYRSAGYARVESARTAEEVAAALLDFRDRSEDSAAAIEGIFADLMVHHVALLDGVMQGVHALLEELSPERIEEAVESNTTALSLTLGRHRALWQEYLARYDELSDQKQALQRIFGSEFAVAYHHYGKKRGG
ncbi:MAG TPA: type VI secretion system-associated FHA domain protein [Polyangiaceae bacterium]|nr:type VI secretion system-associated FHA domain protein [Polyangiaceae bacterium]